MSAIIIICFIISSTGLHYAYSQCDFGINIALKGTYKINYMLNV